MASEQNVQVQSEFEPVGDVSLEQKWKAIPAPTTVSESLNGCFDCNICLDSAHDPVVTLCGHLYCWPCIYKWLHLKISSPESENQPNCPVCKASISKSSLVPLYGRGNSQPTSDAKRPHLNPSIPDRTPALGENTLPHQQLHLNPFQPQDQPFHLQQYFPNQLGDNAYISPQNFVGPTALASPTVGMFSGIVYARMFGSSFSFPGTNYYTLMGNDSPRLRQELELDKSLNRVSIFLFCCIILCLLLF